MKYQALEFSLFGVNTYILWDPATKDAVIVDPAMTNDAECDEFDNYIKSHELRPIHLINTHMHLDHTFGNEHVMQKYHLPLEAHSADGPLGLSRQSQANMFHLPMRLPALPIDKEVADGDVVKVGTDRLAVLDVPGHSPGSIALYNEKGGFVVTGDALFQGSIGRTDLPGGNHAQLISSITDKLLTLPPTTIVLPGHGPASTIGSEMRNNPYI